MQSLMLLGRQPALGLAEIESLYGAEAIKTAGDMAAIVDIDPTRIEFDRLGGSIKFGRLLTELPTSDWREVEKHLHTTIPEYADELSEGKLTLGISVYGFRVKPAAIQATGLTLKKLIRKSGRSVRLVPNKELELSTAQVLHNHLTGKNGLEILLVRNGNTTLISHTVRAQDIESYTVRDRERPKRDARVGMLPPKLAQILINLSVGQLSLDEDVAVEYLEEEPFQKEVATTPVDRPTILDPFCGTGVVLQEALLTGYYAYGSDIEPRMVDYTGQNIEWLKSAFEFAETRVVVELGDATTHTWTEPFTNVACETYLGRPFTSLPAPEILHQTVSECNTIIRKFLKNIHKQMKSGSRLCVAVPAWQMRPGKFKHLPLIDSLEDMGYNRISFEHVRNEDLLYYRSDQVVARELLVLVKK